MKNSIRPGHRFPQITISSLPDSEIVIGDPEDGRWQLVTVYRGLHCPACKKHISELNAMRDEFGNLGVDLIALSADPREKAEEFARALNLKITLAYGLGLDQAEQLGLFISSPLSSNETDRPFAEPAVFLIKPDGTLHSSDITNAPFCRPNLATLLRGVQFVIETNYPPRGAG